MIPGELFIKDGEIELNAGRKTVTLTVANTGDRPIQVGSHYHFFETNPGAEIRSQESPRHAARHRRRHRGALRAGPDPRRATGRARRQTRDLRFSRRRAGETVTRCCSGLRLVSEAAESRGAPPQRHGAQGARQRALYQSSRRGREFPRDGNRWRRCRTGRGRLAARHHRGYRHHARGTRAEIQRARRGARRRGDRRHELVRRPSAAQRQIVGRPAQIAGRQTDQDRRQDQQHPRAHSCRTRARTSAPISPIMSTGPSRSSRVAAAAMPRSTGPSTKPSKLARS